MSGKSHQYRLNIVKLLVDDINGEKLYYKILNEYKDIKSKPDSFLKETVYKVSNYIDMFMESDYSLLNSFTIFELIEKYNQSIEIYKKEYNTIDYVEKNEIILDCGDGFYWIKNTNRTSLEMIIRMDNCGRVPLNNYILELRENKNNHNYTHIVVTIDKEGIAHQIQGPKNEKPNGIYFKYIFDLLTKNSIINGIFSQYPTENEFRLSDFSNEQINQIKLIKPILFKII